MMKSCFKEKNSWSLQNGYNNIIKLKYTFAGDERPGKIS